ncbi:hypothetical protein WSS15_16600 [Acetobacter pasteurianus]|uniref:hypothetical protein n=1 Tax=Acetobacter pasteurianus TaxID=438 RepID=UPI0022C10B29|nr:hypothetical protein [Acetobacter pasteurianus]GLH29010.1 hypothetical protein WSS15_16600 [Acetobacter pasteurianus]
MISFFSPIKERFGFVNSSQEHKNIYDNFEHYIESLIPKLRFVALSEKDTPFPITLCHAEAAIWTEMILNTVLYAQFCRALTGKEDEFIHRARNGNILIAIKKNVSGVFAEPNQSLWQKLTRRHHPTLQEKYTSKELSIYQHFARLLQSENIPDRTIEKEVDRLLLLFKFFCGIPPLLNPLPFIFRDLWHEILLDTEYYMLFCHIELHMEKGNILQYSPNYHVNYLEIINSDNYKACLAFYIQRFGELPSPDIWPYPATASEKGLKFDLMDIENSLEILNPHRAYQSNKNQSYYPSNCETGGQKRRRISAGNSTDDDVSDSSSGLMATTATFDAAISFDF